MPRSSAEILAPARTELARGRPRAALKELDAARAELQTAGDAAGLAEALELARGVKTIAPVDTNSRESLLAALEQGIAALSPAETAAPVVALSAGGQYVTHAAVSSAPSLATARAEMERGDTRRALRSLEKARQTLLNRGDVEALTELLEIAQRLPTAKTSHEKARRELIDGARQNVRYLSRRKALKAGEEWNDPFAAAKPKAVSKLPSLPPMSRREIAIAAAIVVAIIGGITAWALASRAPQRVAHAIKCPIGDEGSPTWSPDGKQIAFAKNGSCGTQITVISVEGGPTREVTEKYGVLPDWSPDGRTILYRSHDGFSVVSLRGGKSSLIRSDDGAMGAVWSPDSSQIAYTHGLTPDFDEYSSTAYVMQSDGSGSRRIIGHSCNPGTPEWSPDGQELAFTCSDGIHATDLSTNKTFLAVDVSFERESEPYGDVYSPVPPRVSWSPDGRAIAYGWDGVNVASSGGGKPFSRTWRQRVIARAGSYDATIDVAWSPDGRKLAFSISDSGSDDGLYVIDRDGSHRKRLVQF